jgi:hypothetical protein
MSPKSLGTMKSHCRRAVSDPPNPFWSKRVREDHEISQRRPQDLQGLKTPVPIDDDLEGSPKPHQPRGLVSGDPDLGASFQTPVDGRCPLAEKPQPMEPGYMENKENLDPLADVATGKRHEGGWGRRPKMLRKRMVS